MKLIFAIVVLCFQFLPVHAQWKKINASTSEDLYDILMLGPIGYICGQNSTILKSRDSGRTWKGLVLNIPSHLRALYFLDSSIGFVSGENARIQKTTDGGKSWSQKYVRTAGYVYSLRFRNNIGIAVGKDMLALRSDDSGESWQVDTTFKSGKKLNSLCILPGGMCWAVGDSGYILKKHLSEKKWELINFPGKINLNHISNFGDSVLIIAGGMPDSSQVGLHFNIFIRSIDSGRTWSSTVISEMKTIYALWFKSKDSGFMAGSNGIINKSYDPFNKRGRQFSGTASNLNKIFFYNEIGLIVGDGGTILRTINNGGFGLNVLSSQINSSVILYPNPGNGELRLICNEKITCVTVYDALGCMLSDDRSGDITMVNIDRKGIFMLLVELENGNRILKKLVVN